MFGPFALQLEELGLKSGATEVTKYVKIIPQRCLQKGSRFSMKEESYNHSP